MNPPCVSICPEIRFPDAAATRPLSVYTPPDSVNMWSSTNAERKPREYARYGLYFRLVGRLVPGPSSPGESAPGREITSREPLLNLRTNRKYGPYLAYSRG